MMNRRALVRAHTHWRPRRAAPTPAVGTAPIREARGGRAVRLAAFATVLVGLVAALAVVRGGGPGGPALPASPRAWLESFSADIATGSGDVCSRLLSPTFTSALEREIHRSCATYYGNSQVLSVRVLRILQSGATAAVEIRYWPRGGYATFVLNHQARGWRAVAIVPGGPLPTA